MSYTIHELAEVSGVSARTIRHYIQRGLLPAPTPQGRYTRYEPAVLSRLQHVRELQSSGLSIDGMIARFATDESSTVPARPPVPAPAIRTAPEVSLPPQAPDAPSVPVSTPVARSNRVARSSPAEPPVLPSREAGTERWARTVLVPGLEIHVREGSGLLVDRLAHEIITAYSLPR